MKTKIILSTIISCYFLLPAFTQSQLHGKVTEKESGEPVIFGNLTLHKEGVFITGTETDIEGNYRFGQLEPGRYQLKADYVGLSSVKIENLSIKPNHSLQYNIQMDPSSVFICELICFDFTPSLFDQSPGNSGRTITSEQIRPGVRPANGITFKKKKKRKRKKNKKSRQMNRALKKEQPADVLSKSDDFYTLPEIKPPSAPPAAEWQGDDKLLGEITCFPNPTSDQLNIHLSAPVKLQVQNANGQPVITPKNLEPGSTMLDVQHWTPGIYFLYFSKDTHYAVQKIIVQGK